MSLTNKSLMGLLFRMLFAKASIIGNLIIVKILGGPKLDKNPCIYLPIKNVIQMGGWLVAHEFALIQFGLGGV